MTAGSIPVDLASVLADWNAGKPVRSLELGHTQRMMPHPGEADRLDLSRTYRVRQELAHEWAFMIVEHCANTAMPDGFEEYAALCDELEARHNSATEPLSREEIDGAESLAWRALRLGWKAALAGHEERKYIEVRKPQPETPGKSISA
jgi:hypothetical protein